MGVLGGKAMTNNECGCCGSPAPGGNDDVKQVVRDSYARAVQSRAGGCCGGTDDSLAEMAGYSASQMEELPEGLSGTSFGCGNPVAIAGLMDGETVLDIGSGAGLDVILAARKVGPTGRAIGLDMTPEMIEKANRNIKAAGLDNVELRLGDAESMPVEDQSVDVIISNCVINLAPDKSKVFSECYRVLKPGGRVMISDMVAEDLPDEIRGNKSAWCSCIAGAMKEYDYLEAMYRAGLRDMQIVARTAYDAQDLRRILGGCCADADESPQVKRAAELCERMAGKVSSITVYAVKKARGGC